MADIRYIDKDFVRFTYLGFDGSERKATLVFGDKVDVLEEGAGAQPSRIRALELFDGNLEGTVRGRPFRDRTKGVLKFSMVDVQQGDGMILEGPPDENQRRPIAFIDAGDNKLFARHAAARFQHHRPTAASPLEVDLILVTHGDADHFDGLNDLRRSETESGLADRKRLFIRPRRVFHNGLVKASSTGRSETERLGRTVEVDGTPMIVDLYDDPRDAPEELRNRPYSWWAKSLDHWEQRGQIAFERIAHGMDPNALFDFLGPLKVEIQGPFTTDVTDPEDGETKPALPFFHKRKKSAVLHLEDETEPEPTQYSTSHTINGHSIALRLTYGNVRFNLTGDLNQESMALMRRNLPLADLEAEIIKAPHHGSADFDYEALKAMRPVVSLISSGDESGSKEHIHPRATLVAALGKVSRGKTGIVLCTELAAFFAKRDYSHERKKIAEFYDGDEDLTLTRAALKAYYRKRRRSFQEREDLPDFFAFERTNFGILHVRTDGERVLVFTHSGKKGMREAYRFSVNEDHVARFSKDVKTG
ncbi:MAG: hypothetical protein AAF481_10240 [Acidobacteriota bacterium]